MSKHLAIRFALHGCANRPFFHLVVLNQHKARNSRPIEVLGSYDPMPNQNNEKLISINFERLHHWIGIGAQPNKTAAEILGESVFSLFKLQ
ncbi:hypothetical protein CAPTEDRAFT_103979 [Capitella teleta]|uniref:Small ribosomal subunit protein bS16m n=1 Tax=Capitella teleta TaxID=283909 RepID=R7V5Y2_CAPTE|nr:hypothetical protein CAPTEDRAFT_103979 [Capitella teleta]|eukprot:ELU14268.1 hypothetical protein CAPTEDRAFT_103979 [Capitella teleta]